MICDAAMLRNGLRILLRWGAEHGIGLSSIRMTAAMICFIVVFVSVQVSIRIGLPHDARSMQGGEFPGKGAANGDTIGTSSGSGTLSSSSGTEDASGNSDNVGSRGNGASPGSQDKIPFVLQISQGRSGSTLTGTMMLQQHPACGFYLDELIMVVCTYWLYPNMKTVEVA